MYSNNALKLSILVIYCWSCVYARYWPFSDDGQFQYNQQYVYSHQDQESSPQYIYENQPHGVVYQYHFGNAGTPIRNDVKHKVYSTSQQFYQPNDFGYYSSPNRIFMYSYEYGPENHNQMKPTAHVYNYVNPRHNQIGRVAVGTGIKAQGEQGAYSYHFQQNTQNSGYQAPNHQLAYGNNVQQNTQNSPYYETTTQPRPTTRSQTYVQSQPSQSKHQFTYNLQNQNSGIKAPRPMIYYETTTQARPSTMLQTYFQPRPSQRDYQHNQNSEAPYRPMIYNYKTKTQSKPIMRYQTYFQPPPHQRNHQFAEHVPYRPNVYPHETTTQFTPTNCRREHHFLYGNHVQHNTLDSEYHPKETTTELPLTMSYHNSPHSLPKNESKLSQSQDDNVYASSTVAMDISKNVPAVQSVTDGLTINVVYNPDEEHDQNRPELTKNSDENNHQIQSNPTSIISPEIFYYQNQSEFTPNIHLNQAEFASNKPDDSDSQNRSFSNPEVNHYKPEETDDPNLSELTPINPEIPQYQNESESNNSGLANHASPIDEQNETVNALFTDEDADSPTEKKNDSADVEIDIENKPVSNVEQTDDIQPKCHGQQNCSENKLETEEEDDTPPTADLEVSALDQDTLSENITAVAKGEMKSSTLPPIFWRLGA